MTVDKASDHPKFGDELKLLIETVLERVEPALRRAAVGADKESWASCDWCPACAAAALIRGEHHEVLGTLADHGTAIVIVLREALAGIPVEPVLPPDIDLASDSAEKGAPGANARAAGAKAASTAKANTARKETPTGKHSGHGTAGEFVSIPVTIKPVGTADNRAGHNR